MSEEMSCSEPFVLSEISTLQDTLENRTYRTGTTPAKNSTILIA